MVDPGNVLAIDDISLMTSHEIRPAVAAEEDVLALIGRMNQIDDMVVEEAVVADEGPEVVDLRESADDAPVVKLVNSLVAQGVDQGASDIHFEPVGGELVVRFRVDGVLAEATRIPRKLTAGVISRIKIMSDLDIAERRIPQDGRTALNIDGRRVDVRVATLPLVGGEGAVLRVLDKDGSVVDLDAPRHGRAGALPLRRGLLARPRRRARHRPDRLGQDDDALRRADPAPHAREEHHHDRGPGRVRARRRQADADQPEGGPERSPTACAR